MGQPNLEVEQDGALLRVWLSRPARRNALDADTLEEIVALFSGLARRFDLRAVVLGGRGPAFSAGADLRAAPGVAPATATERERRHAAQLGWRAREAIEACAVPTVCRLHGYAIGGGLVLALACDFRIAADDAFVSLPEVELGIPLTWGATAQLVREVGAARARELILLCERVPAPRAEALGLLHRVVPAAELDAAVDALAAQLVAKPELAVDLARSQLRALAAAAAQGDVTATDGDLLLAGLRSATGRGAFRRS